jgi:glucan phosphoethanolaminetransferase (alkaline phosphatase superfamily)
MFVALLVAATAAWMLHPRIDAAFPGKHTASIYGPFQATVGAVRMGLTQVAATKLNIQAQSRERIPLDNEPVTVVVVMGESINPARLSLYDFKADTTPNLSSWRADPPAGFTLIPRLGFSGGLDTYASVPGFLRAAY